MFYTRNTSKKIWVMKKLIVCLIAAVAAVCLVGVYLFKSAFTMDAMESKIESVKPDGDGGSLRRHVDVRSDFDEIEASGPVVVYFMQQRNVTTPATPIQISPER